RANKGINKPIFGEYASTPNTGYFKSQLISIIFERHILHRFAVLTMLFGARHHQPAPVPAICRQQPWDAMPDMT
ncbi:MULTISPECIES: hypothetical protein, partial [unclassified Anaerobiospirillum]|uniref:hypothetical protein n=1 Tax=unclassified Anaerobiospirillum TaxID=2647410 RepID=UPI001FF632E7